MQDKKGSLLLLGRHASRAVGLMHVDQPVNMVRRYTYPLSILPQFLEILVLNLPGVLWRLSFGPQRKEEPGSL